MHFTILHHLLGYSLVPWIGTLRLFFSKVAYCMMLSVIGEILVPSTNFSTLDFSPNLDEF